MTCALIVGWGIPASGADAPARGASRPSVATETAVSPKVRALMNKTLKNMRFIEGGSFQMGDFGSIHSPEKLPYSSSNNNKPLHKVTLDSFSMSAFKSTYADLDVYTEATGKPFVGMDKLTKKYRYPEAAAGLIWQEARHYCQWLGRLLDLPMDLPSEAQWEYAARARGQMYLYPTDNGKMEAPRNVWGYDELEAYDQKHNLEFRGPSLPLGQFPPTPLGLYDMMTDGFEWMLDWYDPNYYAASPEKNPKGPPNGAEKVLRSYRNKAGGGLEMGDGMSFARHHRKPDPPKVSSFNGKPTPDANMTPDTAARCVVNSPTPLISSR